MPRPARHGDDERVVADERNGGAPRGNVGQRVRPADADHSGLCRLPPVVAAAHPVVRVGQPDRAEPVLARDLDRAVHTGVRVEVSRTAVPVPPLEGTARTDTLGARVHVHHAIPDHGDEAREAIRAVRRESIATRVGEQASAVIGASGFHLVSKQDVAHHAVKLRIVDQHRAHPLVETCRRRVGPGAEIGAQFGASQRGALESRRERAE